MFFLTMVAGNARAGRGNPGRNYINGLSPSPCRPGGAHMQVPGLIELKCNSAQFCPTHGQILKIVLIIFNACFFWLKRVLERGPEQRESKMTVLCPPINNNINQLNYFILKYQKIINY